MLCLLEAVLPIILSELREIDHDIQFLQYDTFLLNLSDKIRCVASYFLQLLRLASS